MLMLGIIDIRAELTSKIHIFLCFGNEAKFPYRQSLPSLQLLPISYIYKLIERVAKLLDTNTQEKKLYYIVEKFQAAGVSTNGDG
jgi:hypothetical protein